MRRSFSLDPRGPYEFATAVTGHGWFDLAPHAFDSARGDLETAVEVEGQGIDVRVRQVSGGLRVSIVARRLLGRTGGAVLRAALRRTLRLDVDLEPFWSLCEEHEHLRWAKDRRAGYLMQSPTLFEDLLKLLFTTNCSWAATRGMCERLVAALGADAPSGRRAFPSAAACAGQPEQFWRKVVRAGYRSPHCVALARRAAGGDLDALERESAANPAELRRRLRSLPGFGPYAVGQALRGLGHCEDLALDSWCRAKMARMLGRKKPPSDRWFERRYRSFGPWRGLAMWLELTSDWHLGGTFDPTP